MDILKEFHIVRKRSTVKDEGTELVTVKQEAPCI